MLIAFLFKRSVIDNSVRKSRAHCISERTLIPFISSFMSYGKANLLKALQSKFQTEISRILR